MIDDRRVISDELRRLRDRSGLSLQQIAIQVERAGGKISRSYLSEILNGRKTPNPDLAVRIARALSATEEELNAIRLAAERQVGADFERRPPVGRADKGKGERAKRGLVWSVPFPRDPSFTGRDDLLSEIAAAHASATGTRVIIAQAIAGLGGVGKTQLAAHYAHHYAERFRVVWWVEAETTGLIEGSLRALGRSLEVGKDPEPRDVLSFLERAQHLEPWLLIYDNVESPRSLFGLLPTRGQGNVIITTRYQGWPAWAQELDLGPLPESAAVAFLISETGEDDAHGAGRVARIVDGLPLALAQVASYVATGIGLTRYADLLESRLSEALSRRADLPAYDRSVVEVIRLSVEAAESFSPSAGRLLNLMSLLHPDHIEASILSCVPRDDVLHDDVVRAGVLRDLRRFSLIQLLDSKSAAYSIHRVVQAVARETLGSLSEDNVEAAIETLTNAARQDDFRSGLHPHAVLPHVKSLLPVAFEVAPLRTEMLLTFLANVRSWSFHSEDVARWAGAELLRAVERRADSTADDLIDALVTVHRSRGLGSKGAGNLQELNRALRLSVEANGDRSEKTNKIRIELASEFAGQYEWFVKDDQNEDDLTAADDLVSTVIDRTEARLNRRELAGAHLLRGGIRAHLGRLDDALADYSALVESEEGDKVWLYRRPAAGVLVKMGRCRDARDLISPLADIRSGRSSKEIDPNDRSSHEIDQIYEHCLREQWDWAPFRDYVEGCMRVKAWMPYGGMSDYYSLCKVRSAARMLDQEPPNDINQRITRVVAEELREDLVRSVKGAVPSPADDPASYVDLLERKLSTTAGSGPPVYLDHLLDTEPFADRDDLRLRVAVAVRKYREVEVEGANDSNRGNRTALFFYALMREAKAGRYLDWAQTNSAIERALSLGVASDFEVASELISICSPRIPECGGAFDLAIEKIDSLTAKTETHWMYGNCPAPRLLSAAASLASELRNDWSLGAKLELRAASFEEARHGRMYPSVAKHLYSAGRLLQLSGNDAFHTQALVTMRESLEIVEACCGSSSPRWAHSAEGLARLLIKARDSQSALPLAERAHEIFDSAYGSTHTRTRSSLKLRNVAVNSPARPHD